MAYLSLLNEIRLWRAVVGGLNEIGLWLAIGGGVIIFCWGPPQPSFQDYTAVAIEPGTPLPDGRTAGEAAAEATRQRRLYQRNSRIGLALVILGFILQAVAGLPLSAR
jgi:hypothetical protein